MEQIAYYNQKDVHKLQWEQKEVCGNWVVLGK